MRTMDPGLIRGADQLESALVSVLRCHHRPVVEELEVCCSSMIQFEQELLSIPRRLALYSQRLV